MTWVDNRLVLALRLLTFLPTSPGMTFEEMQEELSVNRWKLFRLMKAIRLSDIDIESQFSPEGKRLYYLPKQRQSLINRILRN